MVGEFEPLVVIGVKTEDMVPNDVLSRCFTHKLEKRRIGVKDFAAGIATANAVRSVGDKRTEVCLRPAQFLLGRPQGGVEPTDQHRQKEEERQTEDSGA